MKDLYGMGCHFHPGSHRQIDLPGPDGDDLYLWPSHSGSSSNPGQWPNGNDPPAMTAYRPWCTGDDFIIDLPCPPWLIAAWHAGEPVEPLLDWLVEAHGDAHPWLAEAVAREFAGAGR